MNEDPKPAETVRKVQQTIRAHALEFAITSAAVLAGLFHLLLPRIAVDNITVVLAAIAVLPWLPRLISKITLPGGIKIDFREFQKMQENVKDLTVKVDQLKEFVVEGVSQEQRDRLSTHLSKLRSYLVSFAGDSLRSPPPIFIEGSRMACCYLPASHEIVIQREYARNLDVVSREYMHSVLLKSPRCPFSNFELQGLESGLADYYAASEKGESLLYAETGLPEIQLAKDRSFQGGFDTEDAGNDLGEIWATAFWKLRSELGKNIADSILWKAWMSPPLTAGADGEQLRIDFANQVQTEVEKPLGQEKAMRVAGIFANAGVLPAGSKSGPKKTQPPGH